MQESANSITPLASAAATITGGRAPLRISVETNAAIVRDICSIGKPTDLKGMCMFLLAGSGQAFAICGLSMRVAAVARSPAANEVGATVRACLCLWLCWSTCHLLLLQFPGAEGLCQVVHGVTVSQPQECDLGYRRKPAVLGWFLLSVLSFVRCPLSHSGRWNRCCPAFPRGWGSGHLSRACACVPSPVSVSLFPLKLF